MPLVTIHLRAGKSPTYLRQLTDGIHEALQEIFDVLAADRFQVIHQCTTEELIFDDSYLGVKRSNDVVLIHIVSSATRSLQQKKDLYAVIARNLGRSPGLRAEDVKVILSANGREDVSFGNGVASYVGNPVRELQ